MGKETLKIYVDGSRIKGKDGKPITGIGVVGFLNNKVAFAVSEIIDFNTNNEAEYLAVIKALDLAENFEEVSITIYSDSALVVNQLNDRWKINFTHLRILYEVVKTKLSLIDNKVRIIWIPREKNLDANNLAQSVTEEYKKCQKL